MDELYKQNAKIVYHFLFSLCRDEQLAEDLTQETFLRAFRSMERFDGSCKVSTWLCQIAKHIYYQYLEKSKRETPTDIEERMLVKDIDTEDRVIQRIELLDVLKEMQRLPNKMREVMYLRISGDLSFREIGGILGRSENWARVNFYRGKEMLLKGRNRNE